MREGSRRPVPRSSAVGEIDNPIHERLRLKKNKNTSFTFDHENICIDQCYCMYTHTHTANCLGQDQNDDFTGKVANQRVLGGKRRQHRSVSNDSQTTGRQYCTPTGHFSRYPLTQPQQALYFSFGMLLDDDPSSCHFTFCFFQLMRWKGDSTTCPSSLSSLYEGDKIWSTSFHSY